jgi:hypothetical protein
MNSSDASEKSFTRPAESVLVMKGNLWENNLNFVNYVTTMYVKFTTYVIPVFERKRGGVNFVPPLVPTDVRSQGPGVHHLISVNT